MPELTAPFVFKNEDKRIVYGPVLIPDEPDTDKDMVTADHIENVAHKFVEDYGNIDLMHSLNNVGRLVESYILPVDLKVDENTTVPKGSWVMGVRVTDDKAWKAVKDQKLGGFSIMAMKKTAMKSANKSDRESKRVTLADLGDDWIVNAVSLVDEPAVPKAKFIAIKSKNDDSNINIDNNSDVVSKAVAGSLEHRRRLVRDKLDKTFGGHDRYPYIHSTLEDSVIFRVRDHQDQLKTYQVGYEVTDNGEVDFTEQPQEVLIEENVVPMQVDDLLKSSSSTKDDDSENEQGDRSDGFMAKFMKSIGLGNKSSEKAGKIISAGNLKKLQQAKEVIDDLLSIGEKEREQKRKKAGAKKMEKEDVQKMIDEQMEPVNSKLDDVLNTIKSEAKGESDETEGNEDEKESSEKSKEDDEQEETQESSTKSSKGDDSDDDQEDYKEKYQSALKQLEKAKNIPFSQRIVGQDGAEKSKDKDVEQDRDAFGFKSR